MIVRRAVLKLTISFALVQLALFAAFAFGIYAYVTSAFDFDSVDTEESAATAESSFDTLRTGLLLAYLALLLVVPLTSYALASLALRPVREGYEAQQRFVDDASHEVRTPLAALQAQLELGLARRRSIAEHRDILARSLGAVGRLDRMLDEMLLLTRSDRDLAREQRPVELTDAITDALDQLPTEVSDRVQLSLSPGVTVLGSPTLLGRAVANLISNAARYSPAGSDVEVEVTATGLRAIVAVTDHGVGMSARERRRAFDRFWRADSSRAVEGTGLGLSIVQEIARLHGGRAHIRTHLGSGTTVRLELPLSR